eukprot:33649_1
MSASRQLKAVSDPPPALLLVNSFRVTRPSSLSCSSNISSCSDFGAVDRLSPPFTSSSVFLCVLPAACVAWAAEVVAERTTGTTGNPTPVPLSSRACAQLSFIATTTRPPTPSIVSLVNRGLLLHVSFCGAFLRECIPGCMHLN